MMYFHISYLATSGGKRLFGDTLFRMPSSAPISYVREHLCKEIGADNIVILSITPLTKEQFEYLS